MVTFMVAVGVSVGRRVAVEVNGGATGERDLVGCGRRIPVKARGDALVPPRERSHFGAQNMSEHAFHDIAATFAIEYGSSRWNCSAEYISHSTRFSVTDSERSFPAPAHLRTAFNNNGCLSFPTDTGIHGGGRIR